MAFETQKWPFVQARNYRRASRSGNDVRVIVIHNMEAPERTNTAENVANYFRTTSRPASAHINVDNDSIVQCVYDSDVAYAAPGCNHDGIQVEFAGYASQSRSQWLDPFGTAMLDRGANAVAQYCLKFDIPVRLLSRDELRAGNRGITQHRDVTAVYKRSTHTDPGPNFPWDWFLDRVQKWHNHWTGKEAVRPVAPKPEVGNPLLKLNDSGNAVTLAQKLLNKRRSGDEKIAVDGQFGPNTEDAVEQFQRDAGLSVDGIIGPNTWAALEKPLSEEPDSKWIKNGSRGKEVEILCKKLNDLYIDVPVKDYFDAEIGKAVKRFQRARRLTVDGIVGPQTWEALEIKWDFLNVVFAADRSYLALAHTIAELLPGEFKVINGRQDITSLYGVVLGPKVTHHYYKQDNLTGRPIEVGRKAAKLLDDI